MTDLCSKLNNSGYTKNTNTFYVSLPSSGITESTAYSNIAKGGTTQKMVDIISSISSISNNSTLNTINVLKSNSLNDSSRVIQFLSGKFSPSHKLLKNILLKTTAGVYTDIINIHNNGSVPATIKALEKQGFLLPDLEIFNSSQLSDKPTITPGQESLVYLYRQEKEGSLTKEQGDRKQDLETRNLRFFAAFLIEYCFYKSRYEYLLNKYFEYYKIAPTSWNNNVTQTTAKSLFSSLTTDPTQDQMLTVLITHMAAINTNMTTLRNIASAINTKYNTLLSTIKTSLNDSTVFGSNANLESSINELKISANESSKYLSEAQFKQGLMEYTSEKNRYANMLLGLYAFLNVSALAIIFHLYK
jgi:hypothetical protein